MEGNSGKSLRVVRIGLLGVGQSEVELDSVVSAPNLLYQLPSVIHTWFIFPQCFFLNALTVFGEPTLRRFCFPPRFVMPHNRPTFKPSYFAVVHSSWLSYVETILKCLLLFFFQLSFHLSEHVFPPVIS